MNIQSTKEANQQRSRSKKIVWTVEKEIKVDMYDRVVIFLRFKDENYFVDKALESMTSRLEKK
jgi:hypothetical protein